MSEVPPHREGLPTERTAERFREEPMKAHQ
jgi:hypothetical protein